LRTVRRLGIALVVTGRPTASQEIEVHPNPLVNIEFSPGPSGSCLAKGRTAQAPGCSLAGEAGPLVEGNIAVNVLDFLIAVVDYSVEHVALIHGDGLDQY
jgi:hypothetical protein